MRSPDAARGDVQAFWVRVHAPRDQAAGRYQGQLQIHSGDGLLFTFDLTVRVFGFAVPAASPLPLAVTFAPHDHSTPATRAEQTAWRNEPDYPVNAWKKQKLPWGSLVESIGEYSRDPAVLYEYRNRLAELIERAGVPDVNPWGDRFGVRGFRASRASGSN